MSHQLNENWIFDRFPSKDRVFGIHLKVKELNLLENYGKEIKTEGIFHKKSKWKTRYGSHKKQKKNQKKLNFLE